MVNDVQTVEGYVVHSGMVEGGELSEGDTVELDIHQVSTRRCTDGGRLRSPQRNGGRWRAIRGRHCRAGHRPGKHTTMYRLWKAT